MAPWLLASLSGALHPEIPGAVAWHARLMVLSWSVLLPLGMLIARYFKIWPGQDWPRQLDNRRWFRLHVWLQSLGVGFMTLGLLVIAPVAGAEGGTIAVHHALGWTALGIGWLQVLGALLRGKSGEPGEPELHGDHYAMTPRRIVFEIVHKHLGWLAAPLALGATALGLIIVDAPRWMALMLALWWLALLAAAARLQREGRCIDTYQAIWGPDPRHPGNRRRPIGWGVSRWTG
jgi:hypothetical protein